MDIDQMEQKLREEIPEELGEIEIAKYIYIELGKIKSYDERYYFGNSKTQKKMYMLARNSKYKIEETMKRKKIVCISLTYLYIELLKRFGIKALTYTESFGNHMCSIIYLKNGKKIKADLQLDLTNIQARMKTKYFGSKDVSDLIEQFENITEEENIEIDKKIGYVEYETQYKDEDIKKLKDKCKSISQLEAAKTIINEKDVNDLPMDMGYMDRSKYYINLFKICLPKKQFDILHCFRYTGEKDEIGEKEKQYKMILSVYGSSNKVDTYTFSERENKFIEISKKALSQIKFNEEDKDEINTTYWSKQTSLSPAKKLIHAINQEEKIIRKKTKNVQSKTNKFC